MIATVLAVATVLGGIAALWYFWDKIHALFRPRVDKLAGFSWFGRVVNHAPEQQFVEFAANQEIEVLRLTYCTEKDAGIATDEIDQTIKGRQLRIPIRRDAVVQVQSVGYNPYDGSFNMRLKVGVRVLGEYRELMLSTHVRQVSRWQRHRLGHSRIRA